MPASAAPERTYRFSASRRIEAPPAAVYEVFADYHVAHPAILPKRFFGPLRVEAGGHGAGTVLWVEGKFAGTTRSIRGVVTEPEPGRLLMETYPEEHMVTTFRVNPADGGAASVVTIETVFPRRRGFGGWLESLAVPLFVRGGYREELDNVAEYVAKG